jgi:hypothetical protein
MSGPTAGEKLMQESLSTLRHSARGYLNAVKLCVSAMELDCTHEEQLEFVTDVISSSEKMELLMGQIEAYFDEHPFNDDRAAANL